MITTKFYMMKMHLHTCFLVLSRNKKPRNLLQGLCYIEFVILTIL